MADQYETVEGDRFAEQNDVFSFGLSADERETVDQYAEHHSGGLFVIIRPLGTTMDGHRWYVKAHDSWGDDGQAIVHTYDADAYTQGDEDAETVAYFSNGHDALAAFLAATPPA